MFVNTRDFFNAGANGQPLTGERSHRDSEFLKPNVLELYFHRRPLVNLEREDS
jgi:hypothetical protein